ncbi:midasin [Dorcoceras hygrometricum]|uniref:Midasin n=1 Tax=Dorcoceras hygrometricum TaxID=472368 RepID=A0A2Z7AIW2_9LAMI|nr:midasin [Dorcoceras hygrometricum]
MAVDGSFCLQSELRRFLDRRPKLKSLSHFTELLNKGDLVTEYEVVVAVGQLVLHPKYTIPLLGCLRPIAQQIVERTTTLVHSAREIISDDYCIEEFDDEEFLRDSENVDGAEIINIIDIYVSRKKGLRLHEIACLAFYRALDLIPFLLGSILKYFEDSPAPFERFVRYETFSNTSAMKYPNPVSLNMVDLRKIVSDVRLNDHELREIVSDIRWCSIQILSLVLGLSFKASANLGHDSEQSIHSLLRWQEFCMEVSFEKGSWYLESPVQETFAMVGRRADLEEGYFLKSCRLNCLYTPSAVAHGNVPSEKTCMNDARYPGNSFFLTSNMRKSFEMVSLAVSQRWPVLLYGPSGSGKSTFLKKLANSHGSRVLHLYMDEQMDGKTLIGSYVCSEKPGEFRWQPGSLTQAVLNGFWVVFEDIDKAPPDITSILLPLLEGSNLFSTGHGECKEDKKSFVQLRSSVHILEKIACSVKFNEPVLLVGETGTGKTTIVQTLATRIGQKLTVLNLSQQSDVADLLGGFKPVDARVVCIPLYQEFENLFTHSFSSKDNGGFLSNLRNDLFLKNWKHLLSGFQKGIKKVVEIVKSCPGKKRKRPLSAELLKAWENFAVKLEYAHGQVNASGGIVFSFVEGAFIKALRNGEWILLDEVNLAPPEVLQRVIGVLEDEKGSVCLSERGDIHYICRHRNFRIFACMNPATDAGKRDLPLSIRGRFTEYFVDDVLLNDELDNRDLVLSDELVNEDLCLFTNQFMDDDSSNRKLVSKIVKFYKAAKKSEERLQDGANQKPHYSLRSLYRALEYFTKAKRSFGFERSIYDGFSMFFLNLLDESGAKLMNDLICQNLLGGKLPPHIPFGSYLTVIKTSVDGYVITKSVEQHLKNLARAIFIKRYPVLLQGPTSSGKTSLVWYLAEITGNKFVRINNHEHTDLQEYLGSYITDPSGKLIFQEGALVKAVREGQWIVLDELNLAPSDVLEALNRLLDDNRELFVPELSETIRAHPDFMLFATQNPPLVYGGRKLLSRAFRNRFVEIHVDEIPQEELSIILRKKCLIPESYAKKMVNVMTELQLHRQSSKVFAGKHGFITPRDLFRWANRFREYGSSYEDLAHDGYYLMAERLRDDAEKTIVKEVLERQLKVKLFENDFYKPGTEDGSCTMMSKEYSENSEDVRKIILTKSMWRTYFLIERCYKMREPVLLVGETGGGKTTVCQLLSAMLGLKLHILNCHQYTETSDFLGGFYPVRARSSIAIDFQRLCEQFTTSKAFIHYPGVPKIFMDINQASQTLVQIDNIVKSYVEISFSHPEVTENEICRIKKIYQDLRELHQTWQTIFMWQDGPLVEAMKSGDLFLVDEISLADDSVLERLNSVLEPERKLSLAEKGGSHLENIIAHDKFLLLATMNPGGDYGKKELSPALRNRFTEIWVPSVGNVEELKSIALKSYLSQWFNLLQTGRLLTVRDILSWVSFINETGRSLPAESALIHGAYLVALDGLSLGTNISKSDAAQLRLECLSFLQNKLKDHIKCSNSSSLDTLNDYGWDDSGSSTVPIQADNIECDNLFGIHPFYIEKGTDNVGVEGFEFMAPTTRRNTLRLLRAMQINKPVLLEGSPGVGKTSLIVALGRSSGHAVVRINLSEQTDIMDLLGSDLPVESDEGIQFAWSDGILLQGLNAILDHRSEVFIPELGRAFKCPTSFRVFACQNPSCQGGGRKGLPKSFLNRFTKVYVDELVEEDYISICCSLFPSIERSLLMKLVAFNERLHQETMVYHKFGQQGSPWEFNLRDVIRSCEIIQGASEKLKPYCFLSVVYLQRMRTATDRIEVLNLYEQIFGFRPFINPYPRVQLNPRSFVAGNISIERYRYQSSCLSREDLKILPPLRHCLEGVTQCVKHQWLCILVGPPSSGKTSLIRLLADLTGNVLNELNLSSATDISDLLGCFEQHNSSRHYFFAIAQVEKYMNEYCNLKLEFSPEGLTRKKDLITRWLAFLSNINHPTASSEAYIDNPRMRDSIPHLVEIIEDLKLDNDMQEVSVSWSNKDLDIILNMIRKLEEDQKKGRYSTKFEWVTGLLIKAIKNGEWIVLENANLCNPTVLDRINSLVEQSGSIVVNECGIVEGKPVVLHPHPKFRMFLTINPSHGEVSRAMRNRGVEIYMMQPYWLVDEKSGKNLNEIEVRDAERFISLSGIPVGKLVEMMAKAHIYAMHEGSHLHVSITYLELSRWVRLFHWLITNGNRPCWSIQVSWEHTYLSSFGEGKGKDIVSQAAVNYLSNPELYKFTTSECCLLCLPGGWPTPLKLSDFICYSEETCVRQNCMYLESLGSQIASFIHRKTLNRGSKAQTPVDGGSRMIHLLDATLMHELMFPKASDNSVLVNCGNRSELDLVLAKKKLIFAADWVIEQATENDYHLYIQWFDWFGTRLQQFFSFFNWYSDLFKKELKHPVWTRIFRLLSIDKEFIPVSIFSMGFIDLFSSVDQLKSCHILLINLIKCASQLRLSLRQWSSEDCYSQKNATTQTFIPVLTSLRIMEEKLLHVLVESPSFDFLFASFCHLLEHHKLFWNSIISSHIDCQLIYWRCLMKDVMKLHQICPAEAKTCQIKMKELEGISSLHLNSRKSLLWTYGGHPILPPSAELYQKQCQLSSLCELVWPRKNEFLKLGGRVVDNASADDSDINEVTLTVALSSNIELRLLAMQGVCMSSYIIGKADDGDFDCILQLEEMYQVLLGRLEFEKHKLKVGAESTKHESGPTHSAACCLLTSDALCRKSGFECWLKTQTLVDETTFFLDLELLQHLTEIAGLDIEEQHNIPGYDTLVPHKLFQPLKSVLVTHILQNTGSVRESLAHMLKLRVASHNIWHSSASVVRSHDMLLSAARSLFQQIIYAHKTSFEDSSFSNIRSAFQEIHRSKDTKESIKNLVSLLSSSNHGVFTSLIDSFIEPLLKELYPSCPSDEQSIGYALLQIGCLRYYLLICCDDLDPTVKYSVKYSELTEMIASLELEIQVRKECMYLSGSTPSGEASIFNRINLLERLNAERRKLRRKMVFRPNPENFKKLKHECHDFLKLVTTLVDWMKNVRSSRTRLIIDQLRNWQGTTSCFIDRLSNEFSEYLDVIEPVQAAIYEMKLGLSFFVPCVPYKECNANGEQNIELCLGAIYDFIRFPRVCASRIISVNAGGKPEISIHDIDLSMNIAEMNMDLLKKITSSTCDSVCDTMDSSFRFNIAVYLNVLARIKISAADAHILGDAPFKVLQEIFDKVSKYWMDWMDQKHQIKTTEVPWFKFRARAFNIENITEIDVSQFSNLLAKDSFLELQEMLSEELDGKIESMENDWNLVEESDLGDMVNIHNQLFGSMDLIGKFSSCQVSDAERLSSFHGTYMLGLEMMQGLTGSCSSIFDAKITPEHLLRLCLEYANKFGHSTKSTSAYNFYKDSNSSVLAKLVDRVSALKQRILFLLKEWDDHPALQKILEVIDMILALPLDTPLAKALSGLQFLLSRIRSAQETVVKFPLSDQLEPIFAVIFSWYKLEFESWPALLDEVESQIERSAAKVPVFILGGLYLKRLMNFPLQEQSCGFRCIRFFIAAMLDLLQQPLMPFLEQVPQIDRNNQSIQGVGLLPDPYDVRRNVLGTVCVQTQCKANDRKQSWHTIGNIYISLLHSDELWENKHKNMRKRRAFSDLLSLLDNCGLSKRRTFVKDEFKKSWLLQPSYDVQHLLLSESDICSGDADCDLDPCKTLSYESVWNSANKYYFKSISSMQTLEQTSQNFHKDFCLVQVEASCSYVHHLLEIQQEQRSAAYRFAKQLNCLRQCMLPLSNMFSSSIHSAMDTISDFSFLKNQYPTFKCMWQQKQLFDDFSTMMYEARLLLLTVENTHLSTCSTVKCGAEKIRLFIQNILPDFQKSKNLLDHYLLGSNVNIAMTEIKLQPYGVTKQMELLVNENFQLIKTFKNKLSALRNTGAGKVAVTDILLGHFEDLFAKVQIISEEFYSSLQERNLPNSGDMNPDHGDGNVTALNLGFHDTIKATYKNVLGVFERVASLKYDLALTEESLIDMKKWKTLFEKDIELLQLDLICGDLIKTTKSAVIPLNYYGDGSPSVSSTILSGRLRQMYPLLEAILAFGDNLLSDFLEIHSKVCMLAHMLANIFASLFAKGFGATEGQENEIVKETTQDGKGTGIGEGSGLNDVSDQINDEDQLLGTSGKPHEKTDAMSDIPSKNDKGIEMEQDFDGDAFSVSEDSGNDGNEDDQDEQVDSALGEVGSNRNIIDEKLGGVDDDDGNHLENEKHENGPSVKDRTCDEELRAREDFDAVNEDATGLDAKISSEQNDENIDGEGCDGAEDMNTDNDIAFADLSGLNLDEQNQGTEEDVDMDELETAEPMEDGESSEDLNALDEKNEENSDLMDEYPENIDLEHSGENTETAATEEKGSERDTGMDIRMPEKDVCQSATNLVHDNIATAQSLGQPKDDFELAETGDFAADEMLSDFSEMKNDLAPSSSLHSSPQFQVKVADAANGKTLSQEQRRTSPPHSESAVQKSQPNPCRSVGNAFDGWKERVKVSLDLHDQIEKSDDLMDNNVDEYGYTAEYEEGTAQALGPAAADQINGDIAQNDANIDAGNADGQDPATDIKIDEQTSEPGPNKISSLSSVDDKKKQQDESDLEKQPEESIKRDGIRGVDHTTVSENLVSVQQSFMLEDFNQRMMFPVSDDELGKAHCSEQSNEVRDDAEVLWKRYELLTTRLSQELSEQLRLVMEPTRASRLQGDYKTGKKINMKKVIAFLASHYMKANIWLRRTRPSKRDYQVVIAVDDSRSMSEGHCGGVAVEALVTVCRAMSLLDVGKMAVASFGQQGNIKLLHNFDQPFTAEAGIKMISNLTFKQENTIADEPMAELLKYLNNMLDTAAMHARLPSGYNPLQQLVLIIADGRFNEKEKLKRYVRDILSSKRMVAFLLLDSPNESIIDLMEATVDIKVSRYLDSFPFPFYVVLKNIEALPRTLADLLRQGNNDMGIAAFA